MRNIPVSVLDLIGLTTLPAIALCDEMIIPSSICHSHIAALLPCQTAQLFEFLARSNTICLARGATSLHLLLMVYYLRQVDRVFFVRCDFNTPSINVLKGF